MSHILFLGQLIQIYGLVVEVSHSELGDMCSIPDECWISLQPSAILRGTEPVGALTRTLLYCCPLYNFFFLGFRQWLSCADRVVNLNTTILLLLFWRTWTWARARTCPHVRAWHRGRNYSYYRNSELTDSQVSGFVFSWLLKNTVKTKAS